MRKRILCFLLAVFVLIPLFAIFSSAAVTHQSDVLQDLSTLKVDGVAFNEVNYPVDLTKDTFEIITAVEIGYGSASSSPNFKFFVYIYNPGCKNVADMSANSIQLGVNDECESYFYKSLRLCNQSKDGRFLKFEVTSSSVYGPLSVLHSHQKADSLRVYNIASVRLFVNGALTTYPVNRAFFFSGKDGNLKCSSKELAGLDIDLHFANWISSNAGYKADGSPATIYDHYEINTAYFSVPKSYMDNYDYIQSIRAIFTRFKTTPIIVANWEDTCALIDPIKKGDPLSGYPMSSSLLGLNFDYYLYAKKDAWWNFPDANGSWYYSGIKSNSPKYANSKRYDTLAYYFDNDKLANYGAEDARFSDLFLPAKELENYFLKRYNDASYDASKLYEPETMKTVTVDYRPYNVDSSAVYDLKSYECSDLDRFFMNFSKQDTNYLLDDVDRTVSQVEIIRDPYLYTDILESQRIDVSDELLIGTADLDKFSEFCKTAGDNNEVVILVRFAMSEYNCSPIYFQPVGIDAISSFDYEFICDWLNGSTGYAIQKWCFMEINVSQIVFSKDEQLITVPVVSNTGNSFGNSNIYYDPSGAANDGFGGGFVDGLVDQLPMLKLVFVLVGIVILVIVLAVVLYFIYPYIAPLVSTAGDITARAARSAADRVYRSRERAKERNRKFQEERKSRKKDEDE